MESFLIALDRWDIDPGGDSAWSKFGDMVSMRYYGFLSSVSFHLSVFFQKSLEVPHTPMNVKTSKS